jgi:hypothetical protein
MSNIPDSIPNPVPPDDPYIGLPEELTTPASEPDLPTEAPPPADPRPVVDPESERLTTPPPQRMV